jgi:cyclase
MKHRIIPVILTDGTTVVKGSNFDNWRTVGSAAAVAQLYASRDVDELILLDVKARSHGKHIDKTLVQIFAELLCVPFGVGGGIDTIDTARELLTCGAEKVVLGTGAYLDLNLVKKIADEFGSQAVTVSIDVFENEKLKMCINSGKKSLQDNALEFAEKLVENGAGEIILQSVNHDGMRRGMDLESIEKFSRRIDIPIIASSGAGTLQDFEFAIKAGASAVAAGAIFQFTHITPRDVRNYLDEKGIKVRLT